MKRFSLFLMSLAAIALGHAPTAEADDLPLSFDLSEATVVPNPAATDPSSTDPLKTDQSPLEVNPQLSSGPIGLPATATTPPVQTFSLAKEDQLPPPPTPPNRVIPEASDQVESVAANAPLSAPLKQTATAPAPVAAQEVAAADLNRSVELTFDRASTPTATANSGQPQSEEAVSGKNLEAQQTDFSLDALFRGGPDSLVARIVGSAEGTRTPKGQRTRAYYGHTDPGNGVWNLGSFSYQHGASSPEEADEKQLKRLRRQTDELVAIASQYQLEMTLEEMLNGIDLANQSPRAALDQGGYVERLVQARQQNLQGQDAILWARVRSYLDPDTQQWNAPGLGNNVNSITHDQERRMQAIARALSHVQQETAIAQQVPTLEASVPAQSGTTPAVAQAGDGQRSGLSSGRDRPLSNLIASALDRLMSIDL